MSLTAVTCARGLNALVDAATERRVSRFMIGADCLWDAESVPALARLMQLGTLALLNVDCHNFLGAQEASVPVLSPALRACHKLKCLRLRLSAPNGVAHRIVAELLDAAASLPELCILDLQNSRLQDAAAFGHAFGALLASDLPNLRIVVVSNCCLGDEGLAPLLDGLAANTHLIDLECQEGNRLSRAFKRNRLAPALAELPARP